MDVVPLKAITCLPQSSGAPCESRLTVHVLGSSGPTVQTVP